MMHKLKKGVKKILFLDRGEKEEKTEKIVRSDINRYDQDIEDLRIEVEAINKELEKMKKISKRYRGMFILLILGNLLMGLYILFKIGL